MLNSKELMTKLFQRLPYKIKTEFVTIDIRGESGGTLTDLRFLVENAASAADSYSQPGDLNSQPGSFGP